jgi:hypothetical protein
MSLQRRDFLLVVTLVAAAATTIARADSNTDFSGTWVHGSIPGFEPLASGPTSLVNRSRRPLPRLLQDLATDWQGPGEPPSENVSNLLELGGDYTNPILQPWAAEVVKKLGEMSLAGVGVPNPRNQCWPSGVPFVFTGGAIQILQQPDKIVILYTYDHQVRHVRLDQSHPAHVTPTWFGDSIGHFEGDAVVVDTVGIKVGPFAAWTGTGRRTPRLCMSSNDIGSSITKPQKKAGHGMQRRIGARSRRQTTGASTCSFNSRSTMQVPSRSPGQRP